MNWEIWGPPLAILAGGLFVGAFLATRASGAPVVASGEEELRALHENLIEKIRELDADRGKLDAETHRARRDALVDLAADALRRIDTDTPALPPPQTSTASSSQMWIWGAVTLVFFGVLGVLLTQNSFQRSEGGSMTGGGVTAPPMDGAGGGAQPSGPMMAALEAGRAERQEAALAALAANPQDLAAVNTLTYDALLYRDLDAAMRYMETARGINDGDVDVLIHLAILQSFVGMGDRAMGALAEAEKGSPEVAKLRLWRGFLNGRSGNLAAAEADLIFAAENGSWDEERILAAGLLDELRAGPAPAVATAGPTTMPPAGGGAVHLRGSVSLAEGVVAPEGYTLFLSVRRSPSGGPPAAAQKLTGVTFPLDIALGDGQLLPMAGGAWPEQVWVQARLDADGNAMTKGDTDLESELIGPLEKGTEGLAFVLQ